MNAATTVKSALRSFLRKRFSFMSDLITSVISRVKLYKQPRRIGDITEIGNVLYLIIGIQKIDITYVKLEIHFTCQNLDEDYTYLDSNIYTADLKEFIFEVKTGKDPFPRIIQLGQLVQGPDGKDYQVMEYTDVEIEYTNVQISFLAKEIIPIPRKEAKAKRLNEKKRKLKLEII